MSKLLVETTGDFQLVDFHVGGFVIPHDRPSVVTSTMFVQTNIANGRLSVLAELPDEADDAGFVEALKGSKDAEVAIAAFKAEFEPKEEPRPRSRTK